MAKDGLTDLIEKGFWAILTGISGYAVVQLREISESINQLNTNVAVILKENESQNREIGDIKDRLNYLERGKEK